MGHGTFEGTTVDVVAHRNDSAIWTIVVAAGSGTRFGKPKQFEFLSALTVLDHAITQALSVSEGVVVVLATDRLGLQLPAGCISVEGGATRSESVRAGLAAVPENVGIICVHDAARPLASQDLFRRVIESVRGGADGAVPGIAVTDTIKEVDTFGVVKRTVPRALLVAVQTPQAFAAAMLREAHELGEEGTDDAELVERAGGKIVVVNGEITARKITMPDDLEWARNEVKK
jgi:2-C-methyl-D-erythritol 4-phosphate cytidylyltransferase